MGIATIVAGCQYDPYAHRFVTVEPEETELHGPYVLTSQTMLHPNPPALVVGDKPGAPRITLHPNGTYEATGFPLWVDSGLQFEFDQTVDGSGEWRVDQVGTVSNGWTDKQYYGVRFGAPLNITGAIGRSGDTYELIFGYGDPDAGNAMVFSRR